MTVILNILLYIILFFLFLFQLICSVDPKLLRLTPHDDKIYKEFRRLFPDLQIEVLNEDDIKNDAFKIVRFLHLILCYIIICTFMANFFLITLKKKKVDNNNIVCSLYVSH
jgi:hypothetical protein